jgi:hypothetical protein
MPIRLGTFCVFLLMLVSLGVNMAFFSEVRESFLGKGKSALSSQPVTSEPDIAEFYPQTPPQNAEKNPLPKREVSVEPPVKVPAPIPLSADSGNAPFLLPSVPPPAPAETSQPVTAPKENNTDKQTTALLPPAPKSAAVKPIVADQFKPVMTKPKQPNKPSQKPSSNIVWGTAESVAEQPVRYDH